MGNRAVITTRENFENNGVGVYLHWNGGRDSVEAFLRYCEMKHYRAPDDDCYGWARLCQVIGNFFGGTTSIGIDTIDNLDCDNEDNGVYIIEGWKIVGRKYHEYGEQHEYPLNEMLLAIDEKMPEDEQLGAYFLTLPIIRPSEMHVGDTIVYIDADGKVEHYVVKGIGEEGSVVNGHDVGGVPYISKYWSDSCSPDKNINNYLFDNKEYRKA